MSSEQIQLDSRVMVDEASKKRLDVSDISGLSLSEPIVEPFHQKLRSAPNINRFFHTIPISSSNLLGTQTRTFLPSISMMLTDMLIEINVPIITGTGGGAGNVVPANRFVHYIEIAYKGTVVQHISEAALIQDLYLNSTPSELRNLQLAQGDLATLKDATATATVMYLSLKSLESVYKHINLDSYDSLSWEITVQWKPAVNLTGVASGTFTAPVMTATANLYMGGLKSSLKHASAIRNALNDRKKGISFYYAQSNDSVFQVSSANTSPIFSMPNLEGNAIATYIVWRVNAAVNPANQAAVVSSLNAGYFPALADISSGTLDVGLVSNPVVVYGRSIPFQAFYQALLARNQNNNYSSFLTSAGALFNTNITTISFAEKPSDSIESGIDTCALYLKNDYQIGNNSATFTGAYRADVITYIWRRCTLYADGAVLLNSY